MKNLRIAPIGIGEFLANNEFVVPTYQRSYAWTETQVTNLLTDITGAVKRKGARKGDTYFLGSIVVIERRDKPHEVVDGQQRLATISIILAAIRDYHWRIKKEKAAGAYDLFIRSLHVPTGNYIAKLRLNETDDRCYAKAIVEPPDDRQTIKWTRASHKRILKAYECAERHVKSIANVNSVKETVEALYQIAEYLRSNMQVIRVGVDDDADAFTIFETLNDRHLYLTVADLLKNFLFGMSGSMIEEAKTHWSEMQGALQALKGKKDRTVDFVRQLWGSQHGLVREKDLFRDIKSKILDENEARELSASLAEQAADYVAVLNPSSEVWDKYGTNARNAVATFGALRVERIRPLLLAILNRFEEKEVIKALAFLRSAAVRIVATSGINGTVEEQIFEIAVKVHTKEIKKTSQLAKAMTFVPNDAVFKATFATMSVTKGALARFYLQELEDANKGDIQRVNRDESKVNLEHIIPLSATERAAHWQHLTPDLGDTLSRRLGNQALLTRQANSKLNGGPFSLKAKAYAECKSIYLTSSIARKYSVWGEKEVNARQQQLADLAVDAWPI